MLTIYALFTIIIFCIVISECQLYLEYKPKKKKKVSTTFYSSSAWRNLKYKVFCHYEATCMCCGASRVSGAEIHVDHILPRSKHPELALEFDNMQVLCRDCNMAKSNTNTTDWRNEDDTIFKQERV